MISKRRAILAKTFRYRGEEILPGIRYSAVGKLASLISGEIDARSFYGAFKAAAGSTGSSRIAIPAISRRRNSVRAQKSRNPLRCFQL